MRDRARNISPMLASPRCGAKIRCGGSCRSPAVNARRHGLFTGDAIAERKQIQALLGEARKLLQTMK